MGIGRGKLLLVLLFIFLLGGGIAGGYLYFSKRFTQTVETAPQVEEQAGDFSFVRVYYPSEGRLVMEERRVRRQTSIVSIAEASVSEFLKGPLHKEKSDVPSGAKLLGVYYGSDGVLYVNLSDEFRRNFQGDAMAEFMVLKGLYETVISNVPGIGDVKVIIEGKEIESLAGHIYTLYPLKDALSESR
ncbi:MAG: hypothetical protein OHK0032_14800 [Thermodesulfovibrionales bacterium]